MVFRAAGLKAVAKIVSSRQFCQVCNNYCQFKALTRKNILTYLVYLLYVPHKMKLRKNLVTILALFTCLLAPQINVVYANQKTPNIVTRIASTATNCDKYLNKKFRKHPRLKTTLEKLAYLVPILPAPGSPILKTLSNPNTVQFTLIDSPRSLILLFPIAAAAVSTYLNGLPDWDLTSLILLDSLKKFVSYTTFNVMRAGTILDDNIPLSKRYALALYYAMGSYVLFTAGDVIAMAKTEQDAIYAYSLVAFCLAWPILHQLASLKVLLPLVYDGFPQHDLFTKILDPSRNHSKTIASQIEVIEELKSELMNQSAKKNAEQLTLITKRLKKAKRDLSWMKKILRGLQDGDEIPKKRLTKIKALQTATMKTTALTILIVYFSLQWSLVGTGPNQDVPFQSLVKQLLY